MADPKDYYNSNADYTNAQTSSSKSDQDKIGKKALKKGSKKLLSRIIGK
jgi:hypothetical protein